MRIWRKNFYRWINCFDLVMDNCLTYRTEFFSSVVLEVFKEFTPVLVVFYGHLIHLFDRLVL